VMSTSYLSATVNNLPVNGGTIYVRLFTDMNGTWRSVNYTLTAASLTQAALISPAPSSTLTGASATFSWSAGTGATGYQLWVGSTGVSSTNIYSSGEVLSTSFLSATVNNLPTSGGTIYVRLFTDFNGSWQSTYYTLTAASLTPAVLTSPAPSSTLTAASATFSWNAAAGASGYQLWVGSTGVSSTNIYSSGEVLSTSFTSATVNNLPTNGGTVYVRLFTDFNGSWQSNYYTLTGATLTPAAMISPTPSTTLAGASATFSWSAGTGAAGYQLWLGTTGAGSTNIYSSGEVISTSFLSATVNNLPTNAGTIYARLWTDFSGTWTHIDYTYTAATGPAITSPAPSSTLAGSSVTFTWATGNVGATSYQLWLGSSGVNTNNLYSSGATSATSVTVNHLPTNGEEIFARLYYEINGTWFHADYTYTAATQ
jgi:serine protease